MNGVERHQESLKRRWDEEGGPCSGTVVDPYTARLAGRAASHETALPAAPHLQQASTSKKLLEFSPLDKEMASAVVPPVTVVLEGRSICHRIHLHKHSSYESLALALRRLFVDDDGEGCPRKEGPSTLDLSNAVPGHIVAYEDMEDDLLLAGDLNWKDFVRVAKRIRILPAKASRRKHCGGAGVA
ncbi:hypothetical protein Taro_027512 [Colocasia esculenta]|uniref:Auxin-responsive protein n=1 Tax=Colocasia esculenta TaxID=4460 RepID=A0A843VE38_COLES|nr:hypothetical protein [Colocasia esculenta]